ncbi:YggL family protein [Massilia mucilaginosa]|nr:50S ribosome-binding protein YggL [Massilia mucilaginosa]
MNRASERPNRRQEKKKHVGQFQEFTFAVQARFRGAPDRPELYALMDDFIDIAIEGNGLVFGGGSTDAFSGWVSAGAGSAPLSDEHRALVGAWLTQQPLLEDVVVGPLTDAWADLD